jgi:CheY-like chemotaxis protein
MPKTILVADDDVIVRNDLVRILVGEGYEVFEADSAEEALAVAHRYDGVPDLVIADCFLKTMRARKVCELIQGLSPNLKVLQLSRYSPARLEADENLIPGAEHLIKPVFPKILVQKVRQIFGPPLSFDHLAFSR